MINSKYIERQILKCRRCLFLITEQLGGRAYLPLPNKVTWFHTKANYRVKPHNCICHGILSSSSFFGFSHQGSRQRILHLQLFLSSVSSSVIPTSAMSSFTTSTNLLFAFPGSTFLATPFSASFSQYRPTHHLSSVHVHTTSVLPLVSAFQTIPPLLSL